MWNDSNHNVERKEKNKKMISRKHNGNENICAEEKLPNKS